VLSCALHGEDHVDLFTARVPFNDGDISCREGRQIVVVEPGVIEHLDLTEMTRSLLETALSAAATDREP
jgi:hypothetical protein